MSLSPLVILNIYIYCWVNGYYLSPNRYNRDDAEKFCVTQCNSHLASIHSLEDQMKIIEIAKHTFDAPLTNPMDIWIGLSKKGDTAPFIWDDQSTYNYGGDYSSPPWAIDQSKVIGPYAILTVNDINYAWMRTQNNNKYRSLCNSCDGQLNKYMIFTPPALQKPDYTASEQKCQQNLQTHLASLHSMRDQEEIINIGNATSFNNDNYYIGINNMSHTFQWTDGSTLDFGSNLNGNGVYPWIAGEPDHFIGQNDGDPPEACGALIYDNEYKWDDVRCDMANYYICNQPSEICHPYTNWTGADIPSINKNGCESWNMSSVGNVNAMYVIYNKQWINNNRLLVIDYMFSITNIVPDRNGGGGIVLFNMMDECDYYFVSIRYIVTDWYIYLEKKSVGQHSFNLLHEELLTNFDILSNIYYTLTVKVQNGSMFNVSVNDVQYLYYIDDNVANGNVAGIHSELSGYVGIMNYYSSSIVKSLYISGSIHVENIATSWNCPAVFTLSPTDAPTDHPTPAPTNNPSPAPTIQPSTVPTSNPTSSPTAVTTVPTTITVSPTMITQGPTVNTPSPTTITVSPTTFTLAPTVNTKSPTTITVSPTSVTPGPTTITVSPTTFTLAPTTITVSPTSVTPGPTSITISPTANTPSPTSVTPEPTSITTSPTADTPGPTANTPSPTDVTPSPTAGTDTPTSNPTPSPTDEPTPAPITNPTEKPSDSPITPGNPTRSPTNPTTVPSKNPTAFPTPSPTNNPTPSPTNNPTPSPTNNPTPSPTNPTASPTTNTQPPTSVTPAPTAITPEPTNNTPSPTDAPIIIVSPTLSPTDTTRAPTRTPTYISTHTPTLTPTNPTFSPITPTLSPITAPPTNAPVASKYSNNYYLSSNRYSWDNAGKFCESHCNSNLSSIHSIDDQNRIQIIAENSAQFVDIGENLNIWIGLELKDGVYKWSDGTIVDFGVNTSSPLIDNYDEVHLFGKVSLSSMDDYSWKLQAPSIKSRVICNSCDAILNKYIYFRSDVRTYNESEEFCMNKLLTHLGSIHSKRDQDEASAISIDISSEDTFIGLNNIKNESKYIWTDGTPFNYYFYWESSSNPDDDEKNCVILNADESSWDYIECDTFNHLLCNAPSELCNNYTKWEFLSDNNIKRNGCDSWNIDGRDILFESVIYNKQWRNDNGLLIIDYLFRFNEVNSNNSSAGIKIYNLESICDYYYIAISSSTIFLMTNDGNKYENTAFNGFELDKDYILTIKVTNNINFEILIDNAVALIVENPGNININSININMSGYIGIVAIDSLITAKSLYISGSFEIKNELLLFEQCGKPTTPPTYTYTPSYTPSNAPSIFCEGGYGVGINITFEHELDYSLDIDTQIENALIDAINDEIDDINITLKSNDYNVDATDRDEIILIKATVSVCNIHDENVLFVEFNNTLISAFINKVNETKLIVNINNIKLDLVEISNILFIDTTTTTTNDDDGISSTFDLDEKRVWYYNTFWMIIGIVITVILCCCIMFGVIVVYKCCKEHKKNEEMEKPHITMTIHPIKVASTSMRINDNGEIIDATNSPTVDTPVHTEKDGLIKGEYDIITKGNHVNGEQNDTNQHFKQQQSFVIDGDDENMVITPGNDINNNFKQQKSFEVDGDDENIGVAPGNNSNNHHFKQQESFVVDGDSDDGNIGITPDNEGNDGNNNHFKQKSFVVDGDDENDIIIIGATTKSELDDELDNFNTQNFIQ